MLRGLRLRVWLLQSWDGGGPHETLCIFLGLGLRVLRIYKGFGM